MHCFKPRCGASHASSSSSSVTSALSQSQPFSRSTSPCSRNTDLCASSPADRCFPTPRSSLSLFSYLYSSVTFSSFQYSSPFSSTRSTSPTSPVVWELVRPQTDLHFHRDWVVLPAVQLCSSDVYLLGIRMATRKRAGKPSKAQIRAPPSFCLGFSAVDCSSEAKRQRLVLGNYLTDHFRRYPDLKHYITLQPRGRSSMLDLRFLRRSRAGGDGAAEASQRYKQDEGRRQVAAVRRSSHWKSRSTRSRPALESCTMGSPESGLIRSSATYSTAAQSSVYQSSTVEPYTRSVHGTVAIKVERDAKRSLFSSPGRAAPEGPSLPLYREGSLLGSYVAVLPPDTQVSGIGPIEVALMQSEKVPEAELLAQFWEPRLVVRQRRKQHLTAAGSHLAPRSVSFHRNKRRQTSWVASGTSADGEKLCGMEVAEDWNTQRRLLSTNHLKRKKRSRIWLMKELRSRNSFGTVGTSGNLTDNLDEEKTDLANLSQETEAHNHNSSSAAARSSPAEGNEHEWEDVTCPEEEKKEPRFEVERKAAGFVTLRRLPSSILLGGASEESEDYKDDLAATENSFGIIYAVDTLFGV